MAIHSTLYQPTTALTREHLKLDVLPHLFFYGF